MTEENATTLLDKWVRILKLESWDIKLRWKVLEKNMEIPNSTGCCLFNFTNRQAVIQMLDENDYDNEEFAYNYEQTLIHELLHLKFAELDDDTDPTKFRLIHRLIEDLSKSFAQLSKGA